MKPSFLDWGLGPGDKGLVTVGRVLKLVSTASKPHAGLYILHSCWSMLWNAGVSERKGFGNAVLRTPNVTPLT